MNWTDPTIDGEPYLTHLQYGIGVPPGYVAKTAQEAEEVAKKLSTLLWNGNWNNI